LYHALPKTVHIKFALKDTFYRKEFRLKNKGAEAYLDINGIKFVDKVYPALTAVALKFLPPLKKQMKHISFWARSVERKGGALW